MTQSKHSLQEKVIAAGEEISDKILHHPYLAEAVLGFGAGMGGRYFGNTTHSAFHAIPLILPLIEALQHRGRKPDRIDYLHLAAYSTGVGLAYTDKLLKAGTYMLS